MRIRNLAYLIAGHVEPCVGQEAGGGVQVRGEAGPALQGLRQGLAQRGPPGLGGDQIETAQLLA